MKTKSSLRRWLGWAALPWLAALTPTAAAAAPASPAALTSIEADTLERYRGEVVASYQPGGADAGALAGFYADDIRLMPEYQPTLIGPAAVTAYRRAFFARFEVTDYRREPNDRLDLGAQVLAAGIYRLEVVRRETRQAYVFTGNWVEIWRKHAGGAPQLAAEVMNLDRAVPDGDQLRFPELPGVRLALQARLAVTGGVGFELAALNRLLETAIVQHDAPVWSLFYADDAVLSPNLSARCVGRRAIDAYIAAHVRELPVFEKLDLRHDRIDDLGGYVVEYASHVANWRNGDASGVSTGKNVRIWRREPGGGLRIVRQAGSYD